MNIYDEAEVITHEEIMRRIEENIPCSRDMFVAYINQQKKKDERAKKVEELLTYQNHYIDSIIIELDRITKKAKASQIGIIKKELEEMK